QERRREIDRVGEHEQHPVLHRQSQRLEARAEAVHALGQLAEGIPARVVDERRLARAPGAQVALDQVVRGVVVARNVEGRRVDAATFASWRQSPTPSPAPATASSSGMVPALASWSMMSPMRRAPSSARIASKRLPPLQKVSA